MKKYEIVSDMKMYLDGFALYRIRACMDFTTVSGREVKKGDLGGLIAEEKNLSQEGKAWIFDDAEVFGNAVIFGNAEICDKAEVFDFARVFGNAIVSGNASVCGNATVFQNALVFGKATVYDEAKIYDNAKIFDNAKVFGNARVCGNANVCGNARVCGNAFANGNALVRGNARISGNASVSGDAEVFDDATVFGDASVSFCAEVYGNARVFGNAEVFDDAKVCSDASISSTEHIFYVRPIGEYAQSLTLFRTKNCEIKVSFDFESYDLDTFKEMVADWEDARQREVALAALELGQKHIDLSSKEQLKPCPFCGGDAEHISDSNMVVCQNCGIEIDGEVWNRRVC